MNTNPEDLNEENLDLFFSYVEAQMKAGDPKLVLHPTEMILRPDLTEKQMELAHRFAAGRLG